MIRSAFFSCLAFALGGCLSIPEGVFACFDATDCPEGFDCMSGFCVEEGGAAMRQCDDGSATIRLTEFCDGVPNCDDASDELECVPCVDSADPSTDTQIPRAWLCDGHVDCPAFVDDASRFVDEDQCLPCDDEGVVHSFFYCDGATDCGDGSDENECFFCATDPDDETIGVDPIPRWNLCNGFSDCAGGADEFFCDGQFTCDDGLKTIPRYYVCDGYAGPEDCTDQSDETELACALEPGARTAPETWPLVLDCGDGSGEVPTYALCQGVTQCANGADEVRDNCPFVCANGKRIPREWLCDTIDDCGDADLTGGTSSDEGRVRGYDPCAVAL